MPLGDHRLRSAVAPLLAQKRSRRRPAAVPHERAGVEADLVAGVEDAETQVDVVTGGLVTHIEPADRVEHLATDREIASGYVLGPLVVEHHVSRTTRRGCDSLCPMRFVARRDVGTTACGDPALEVERQVVQPLRRRKRVGVQVRDEVMVGRGGARVACRREPDVVERDELHTFVSRRDLGRAVLRPVVDHDDLELRIAQPGRVPQAFVERRGRVIGTDHNTYARPNRLGDP